MKNRNLTSMLLLLSFCLLVAKSNSQSKIEPMATGKYQPTWESLRQYNEAPEWFQNAKFGMWAHWGPQCQPAYGDWYARMMYYAGTSQYNYHLGKYGSPGVFGFKDVINSWKAQSWNPDSLVHLYKNAGAQYFFAMANHHDNFDMYDSKYQRWNSISIGPKKDIIGGWAQAAKKYGLPFGVSVHASRAWTWLEPSQDWDGNLTTADGTGKWWEGLNPQDLYAQRHTRSTNSTNSNAIVSQWEWGNGASLPDTAYINKYYNRTIDLINKYNPDLIYFDDTSLPLTPISDVGLRIAAHLYNKSINENAGKNRAVIFGKKLTEVEKNALVWDVERGVPDRPQQKYWQTCTCIGDWHYSTSFYNNNYYKSAQTVIRMLLDIVSKNGNMLLNIPVKGDGTIDDKEYKIVQDLTAWMNVNKVGIYSTRPWITFGEGPTADAVNPLSGVGFNEGTKYTSKDIRYTCIKDTVFAAILGWPTVSQVTLKALSTGGSQYLGKISKVNLLGYGELTFTRDMNGLNVNFPVTPIATGQVACILKIQFEPDLYSYEHLVDLIKECELAVDAAKKNQGNNTGQFNPDSIAGFVVDINAIKIIPASASAEQLRTATISLQTAFHNFLINGINKGGKLTFTNTQNITREVLGEARNFARSDAGVLGTGRWGLLAEPWIVTNNIINQESSTRGGFDNYSTSQSIGIQKWYSTDPAITNGMIYQVVKLPAGTYKLKIKVHEKAGLLTGENYMCVAKGVGLPNTSDVPSKSLSYYDMALTSTGGQYTVCQFKVDSLTELSIGWSVTLAANTTSRSMRVNEILLLDANGIDKSATYLKNYSNIQRKDQSFARYGTPVNWIVQNYSFNMPNNQGIKKGIDTQTGYKSLMMGVWDDLQYSTGNLNDVKMYKKVTLPAGRYAFLAGYDAVDRLTDMNMFVSRSIPTALNAKSTAIAYFSIAKNTNDGVKYGLEFSLNQTETLYIGWVGSLTVATQQEFRAKEVALLKILNNQNDFLADKTFDVSQSGEYVMDMSKFDVLNNLKWSSSLDNVNYVIGASSGQIELGYIDFGIDKTQDIIIQSASNTSYNNTQTYLIFKDGETTPFTTIAAKNTGGNLLFESLTSSDFQLNGVHKITLKYNNHASNIKSVGFQTKLINSNNPLKYNPQSVKISSKNHNISVIGANSQQICIYDIQGKLLKKITNVSSTVNIPVSAGIYVVRVDDFVEKVIVN